MKIADLVRAEKTPETLADVAEQLAAAVKARAAYLAQDTKIEPNTLEAAEVVARVEELDADIEQLQERLLALLGG